jgi:hypothetical protein
VWQRVLVAVANVLSAAGCTDESAPDQVFHAGRVLTTQHSGDI